MTEIKKSDLSPEKGYVIFLDPEARNGLICTDEYDELSFSEISLYGVKFDNLRQGVRCGFLITTNSKGTYAIRVEVLEGRNKEKED